MAGDKHSDGVSDTNKGGQSQGGRWPGKNDAPADNDLPTHNVTENKPVRDAD